MQDKSLVLKRLTPANDYMAEAVQLRGSDISRFTKLNGLHLSEAGFALGINTAGLYAKTSSEKQLSSTLSILLRMFSAFPQYMPHLVPPPPEELVQKIQAIDPSFKKRYIGPLLGLNVNSSFRIMREGPEKASVTARHLMWVIDQVVSNTPEEWPTIRAIIEIEAQSREIPEGEVWMKGGWKKHLLRAKAEGKTAKSTAKPLKRLMKSE